MDALCSYLHLIDTHANKKRVHFSCLKAVTTANLLYDCLLTLRSMEILMCRHQTPAALLPPRCARHTLLAASIIALFDLTPRSDQTPDGMATREPHAPPSVYGDVLICNPKLFLCPALHCVTMSLWMIMWERGSVCCHRAGKKRATYIYWSPVPPAMARWVQL